jgi:integrase
VPKKRLTEEGVKRMKPPPHGKQVDIFDAGMPGLILRVSYGGAKTFRALYYVRQKPKTHTLGRYPVLTLAEARDAARKFLADPQAALKQSQSGTFKTVAEDFITRHVKAEKLRSGPAIERCLKKYVYPEWQDRLFVEIGRGDVSKLLDSIQDNSGPRMADAVLAYIRKMMNWFAARSDDYMSPIVRGMNRSKAKARKRKHSLNDEEIRVLWKVAPKVGSFGALVKVLMLSAQRREKVACMKRSDVIKGLWEIDSEPREKGNAGAVRLTKPALALINSQPEVSENPFVFAASSGKGPFNSFSQRKDELDELLRADLPEFRPWVLHDLRRTARSLMARAGVLPHIAERTLGHAVPDLEDNYDRHSYLDEKSDALEKLSALISAIVSPLKGNVIAIAGRKRRAVRISASAAAN